MTVIEQPHTPLVDVDDETLALILELQRQDGELFGTMAKGKQREGSVPCDAEIALELHLEELAVATVSALDRRIARSIQRAVREDADTLKKIVDEEDMATQDRRMSLELSRGVARQPIASPAASTGIIKSVEDEDMELLEKMSYLYVSEHDGTDELDEQSDDETVIVGQEAESSRWAAARPHRTRECVACGDRRHFTDVLRAPCQHEYCRDCLRRLFEDAMRDESLFPPRCCKKPIPLDRNRLFLPQTLVETFREKAVEFSAPNRTYCHRKEFQAFLHPAKRANSVARYGDCSGDLHQLQGPKPRRRLPARRTASAGP
ncbi:hypothetical protein PG994_012829 [Apiospora phragmitis]|uniref:RING-type domain-containing protein n=1 Tax=Apiospora phragmitis TaxID=2905665 RepID=A0ABR1T6X4_9PEZI